MHRTVRCHREEHRGDAIPMIVSTFNAIALPLRFPQ
jgi:hypothetical protein